MIYCFDCKVNVAGSQRIDSNRYICPSCRKKRIEVAADRKVDKEQAEKEQAEKDRRKQQGNLFGEEGEVDETYFA